MITDGDDFYYETDLKLLVHTYRYTYFAVSFRIFYLRGNNKMKMGAQNAQHSHNAQHTNKPWNWAFHIISQKNKISSTIVVIITTHDRLPRWK